MRDIIVALDLETTGLDPYHDRIIEIGAVKFQGDRVLDEFQSFINPGCAVPAGITQLTGISTEDVQRAPRISQALPGLRRILAGTEAVLAHNVRFDLGFLQQVGFEPASQIIDTYLIASVLAPSAARYSLSALASMLAIPTSTAHRALADAYTTMSVYLALRERAATLPLNTLAEIVRQGQQVAWDAQFFFESALAGRRREVQPPAPPTPQDIDDELADLFGDRPLTEPSLRPGQAQAPIDVNALAELIEPGGSLVEAVSGYEHRPQQVEMLRHVGQALNQHRHAMVEAPTGVGKSLAYLIPAAAFAIANNDRVVISTNTINLQDQLINKDIPLLQQALGIPLRAAVLKGRVNYLCPRRLAALRRRGPTSAAEMHMLAKILVWLTTSSSGDRGEITLRGPAEMNAWRRLSADDEGCTTERCMSQMGGTCPFYRARRQAEAAHLLVVNHALLLSDVVTEGRVLPDYRCLIVDEAHHLEDAVTSSMTFRTDPESISRQVAELGTQRSGLLGDLLRQTRGSIPPGYHATLVDYAQMVESASSQMTQHVELLFKTLRVFLEEHVTTTHSGYAQQIRIVPNLRRQPGWTQVEVAWDNLSNFTSGIAEAMNKLADGLAKLADFDIDEYDDLVATTSATARHLTELHQRLNEIVVEPDHNAVYWVELQPDGGRMSLHAAPLDIGPLVDRHLWQAKETVIMTSATLRTDGTFDFIRERLDASDIEEVVIDTPFDYKNNALLYIASDMPEPSDQAAYQSAVERGILELCRATQGRALVLFTSYAQLRATASAISDALMQDGITVYDQSDGVSRTQLLESFVQSEKSVLMGTRSFWEGVDIPGPDLSVLIIVRLPFSVPSEPLFAARSELFEDSFQQYALPETILRFRQGFGRLIRRRTDRGVVAIFDRRVISKPYGQMFLNSLPECTRRVGRLIDLPAAAVEWLGRTDSVADAPF